MMKKLREQSGFTLVETIVVAILTSVLALGAYSVFMMYINETREITARIRLQTQYETLADEIARTVRLGGTIKVDSVDGRGKFAIIKGGGIDSVVFSFAEDRVQISRDGEPMQDFVVANNLINITEESVFIDTLGNRQLIMNITLVTEMSNREYRLTVNGGIFRCRN